ncbi:Crp/Fnr family transcriptional regulator [Gemmatimonadota bacterium]
MNRVLRSASKTLEAFLQAKEEELALARALADHRRSGGAARRLATLLLHLSERLGRGEGKGIRLPIRLTHQVLADLLGAHRSTVTTLLNDWIYEGFLRDEEGGLLILRRDALSSVVTPV